MSMKNKSYQILGDYKHLYFFDYTWDNFRKVNLYSREDINRTNKSISELEGLIFSSNQIVEQQVPITEFEQLLKNYKCKIFYFEDLTIVNSTDIGKEKQYKKLVVSNNSINIDVLIFTETQNLHIGDKITFTATISKNEFRNNITYNLMLKEIL